MKFLGLFTCEKILLFIWLVVVVINYLFDFFNKNFSYVNFCVKIFNAIAIRLTNTIAKNLYTTLNTLLFEEINRGELNDNC